MADSSSGDTDVTIHDFENPPPWKEGRGPAKLLPKELRDIRIAATWRVEWLDMENNVEFQKNHMVSVVSFLRPYRLKGQVYIGARVSMELSDKPFQIDYEEWVSVWNNLPQRKGTNLDIIFLGCAFHKRAPMW
jgi:hypothetical protein